MLCDSMLFTNQTVFLNTTTDATRWRAQYKYSVSRVVCESTVSVIDNDAEDGAVGDGRREAVAGDASARRGRRAGAVCAAVPVCAGVVMCGHTLTPTSSLWTIPVYGHVCTRRVCHYICHGSCPFASDCTQYTVCGPERCAREYKIIAPGGGVLKLKKTRKSSIFRNVNTPVSSCRRGAKP